ncbi:predicted protein [Chaetomium globosum CBS 148.51]|uniref:Uncharacterized protein n=1 Tax=Chaetomium globosum (strain ATCC 6205 / CBS 148.51 / DSM 1962 / NBRC 6347 / NRRL 1970) TaxID=306901 RepID=Q2H5Z4_CHAGB|nr:uncharacterized protein CHGG_05921 [Chaetomium globosum CBS 148.51]EAQ89302.1 predicted protein [Chaetomium globosum CBS 148.51]
MALYPERLSLLVQISQGREDRWKVQPRESDG